MINKNKIAEDLNIIDQNSFAFCWITDFPIFELDQETSKIKFSHNPFSMPQGDPNNNLKFCKTNFFPNLRPGTIKAINNYIEHFHEATRDDTHVLLCSSHSIGLAGSCLSISEDAHIKSINAALNQHFRVLEDLLLLGHGAKTSIKDKLFLLVCPTLRADVG